MCGIWGFVGETEQVDVASAYDGLCSLTDRGPDDWGLYLSENGKVTSEASLPDGTVPVALGNRRLSILDLSAAGNQPMATDDGRWIVYNGEVYNYRELRADLRAEGYEFHTETDTEVILQAYEAWGADCVERFRGMFAFAVYDETTGELFAARDRFGIKPLYYDHREERLAFASEVTALLEADVTPRRLSHEGVDGFLALGYVPGPGTIVDGVRSLPPGSVLHYDPADDEVAVESYWSPSFGADDDAAADRVRDLLEESVALRLRSDVPVGAFLSGGLDSSTIVALMREVSSDERSDLHTYAVGFDSDAYTETAFAESVADEFDTVHHSETVTAADVERELDAIVAKMDQPTIDGINTYFVSKLAADDGLKVALSGLGSDELFYGYPSFASVPRRYRAARALYTVPRAVRKPLAGIAERAGRLVLGDGAGKLADAVGGADPFGAAYLSVRGVFARSDRERLLGTDEVVEWDERVGADSDRTLADSGAEDAVSNAELTWYMRDQLLRQTDVMSMAHSLEVRVPFLDTALAEYVLGSTPVSKRGGEKSLLKAAVGDVVPLDVLEREKTGFEFPFAEWLRSDLAGLVDDALAGDSFEDVPVSGQAARSVNEAFRAGNVHWSRPWALVVLALWVEEHLS